MSKKLVPEKSDATKKYNAGEYSEGEKFYIFTDEWTCEEMH